MRRHSARSQRGAAASPRRPSRWRRTLCAAAALSIPAYLTYAPATSSPAAADEADTPKIMLVMDASGSMAGLAEDGTTKIDAAKSSLTSVLAEIPADVEVGFRVFGATAEPNTPEACTDSQLTAPVTAGDRTAVEQAIASYSPKGETPISYALEQAAADLGDEGPRSIILVSDGEATCAPDPCTVASQIAATGVDVRIDVIGLGVAGDAGAQQQLQCVAAAAGGQYYDATTQQELGDSLSQLAERAAHPFEVTGEPVSGTPTVSGAPKVTYGTWLDTIGVPGTVDASRFYRIERTIPGSTLHITASLQGSDDDSVKLRAADGDYFDASYGPSNKTGLLTTSVTLDPRLSSTDDGEKYMDDYVDIAVDRDASDDAVGLGPLPLQLIVIEEPPVDGVKGLPQPQDDSHDDPVTGTWVNPGEAAGFDKDATAIIGGTSMANAEELGSGHFEGTLAPGEVQVYKVPLQFGQFLSAQADFPDNGEVLKDAIYDGSVKASIGVYDSALRYCTLAVSKNNGVSQSAANDTTIKAQTSQVRYLNRLSSSERTAYVDGYYYIVLSLSPSETGDTFLVPFTMDVGVHGEVADVPAYAEDPPQQVGDGSAQPSQGAQADADPAADSEEGSSSRAVWVAAAAIGGAACLAGAVTLLLRRKRTEG